jgi:predicted metalloprotease with PDZ domain
MPARMRYRVSMPEPRSHLFQVEAELDEPGPEAVLALPVWTPGSYLVREFARHLEGFAAADDRGRPLAWERLDKHRFLVRAAGAPRLVARYRIYANDLGVRTSHLDGTHAFWNGANLFLHAEGRLAEPCRLEVEAPPGWRADTALEGGPAVFEARDYHELADSPVEVGTHAVADFEALGRSHRVAAWGRGNLELAALAADLKLVVEQAGAMLGSLPYPRYLFIVHLSDRRRGGLEHAGSTTLAVDRHGFAPRPAYLETLSLAAHEHLHAWNVKRLRPAALAPYDYGREQYTRLLWWFEGATSYWDRLLLVRAGLLPAADWLRHLGTAVTHLLRTPGAAKASLEEASLLAWVKHYRPDENSVNSTVSYYRKGEVVAAALDLFLRRRGRSLDGLLRLLLERHTEGGLPEDGVERAVAEWAGAGEARAFFDRHVRGTGEVELDLDLVGLALRRRPARGLADEGGAAGEGEEVAWGWLGAEVDADGEVSSVREGSPAWSCGLTAGDEIVAEGGFRADREALWARMRERGPGGQLRLHLFRRGELLEVAVPLGAPPEDTAWLEPAASPTEAQRAAFRAWCGAAHPAGGGPAPPSP